jgi:sterol desaturase/sphingolipid hydroxylase (fatty acid hydroxylase superfamily)
VLDVIKTYPYLFASINWFALSFVLFGALSFVFANRPNQPLIRGGYIADTFYWFFGQIVYSKLYGLTIAASSYLVVSLALTGREVGMLAGLPLVLQIFLILFSTDIIQYWVHRAFHGKHLWDFHAIHHSSREVDWLSAMRVHPVNYLFQFLLPGVISYMLGFSAEAYIIMAPFNAIYSSLVHANLSWSFGPLRYVLASPTFHRWHHTYASDGGMRNFAPTFPFIDLAFGTFYMPQDSMPERFGTEEIVPEGVIGQFVYPFRTRK